MEAQQRAEIGKRIRDLLNRDSPPRAPVSRKRPFDWLGALKRAARTLPVVVLVAVAGCGGGDSTTVIIKPPDGVPTCADVREGKVPLPDDLRCFDDGS